MPFLPIDGTIEITNYMVDTPIYIELYQIIEPYLGRRNTFEIAYSVVIKDGTNTFNVTKPVQFEFVAPFKVDNDVNAYLIDGSNVTALTTSVDDTQVLVMTTKLNNIVILKSKNIVSCMAHNISNQYICRTCNWKRCGYSNIEKTKRSHILSKRQNKITQKKYTFLVYFL